MLMIFPDESGGWVSSVTYLADDVLHLLSMDDVGGIDDSCVAGSVHLSGLLVLRLEKKNSQSALIINAAENINRYSF